MPPTAARVIEITMNGVGPNGRAMANVLHYYADENLLGAGRDDILVPVVEDVRDNWQDHIVPILGLGYTFQGCSWVDLNTSDGATGQVAPNAGKDSTGNLTAPPPPNVATLVTKVISGAGRTRRNGRMYLWIGNEGSILDAGTWDPAALATWQAALDTFLADTTDAVLGGVAGSQHMVTVSWPRDPDGSIPGDAVGVVNEVVDLVAQSQVATQRRRLRG